jgi:hypothetical protein
MQKSPPRFVPTLTQVVTQPPISATPAAAHMPGASMNQTSAAQPTADDIAQQLRQQLLVRTRQYMDIELQRRIRETVSQLALEHAHKLFEEIQPKLEATITQVVEEAVQQAVKHASQHVSANAP